MAKNPSFAHLPQEHNIGKESGEEADRSLYRADAENWQFYQEAQRYARDISDIQAGVKEDTARTIEGKSQQPDALQEAIKKERLQAELYRAVQGNEFYETGGVPSPEVRSGWDTKHYLGSETDKHLRSGVLRKIGRQFHRLGRGVIAMVGANNYIEAKMTKRFGKANLDLEGHKTHVLKRLKPVFIDLAENNYNIFLNLCLYAGFNAGDVPNNANDIEVFIDQELIPKLADKYFNLEKTKQLGVISEQVNASQAFKDLLLLLDTEQRETVKIGIEGVYNAERLRFFIDARKKGSDEEKKLIKRLEEILEENALYTLEGNPEAMALVAEIEFRFSRLIAKNTNSKARKKSAAQEITNLLDDIAKNELPGESMSQANVDKSNKIKELGAKVKKIKTDLIKTFQQARSLANRIHNFKSNNKNDNELNKLHELLGKAKETVIEIQDNFITAVGELKRLLTPLDPANNILDDILKTNSISELEIQDINIESPRIKFLIDNQNTIEQFLDSDLTTNFISKLKNKNASPFVLLQRLLRRTYCKKRGKMDSANYQDEEVNRYATLSASMRVQDAKNADLFRNSNRRAADFLKSGLLGRGVDKVKSAMVKTQNLLGLEVINVKERSEDVLLKQIINSRAEFAVFKGVNKFTTTRDLRKILNDKNIEVSWETLERFIQTLEEVVSEYKKGELNEKDFGILKGDWDIENLIVVLQKFKSEKWNMELMKELEGKGGNREQAFIKLLQEKRALEQKISQSIRAEIKHPNAVWRKLLVKTELKEVLQEKSLEALKKLRKAGISSKEAQIKKIDEKIGGLSENSPNYASDKAKLEKDKQNLNNEISGIKAEINDSQDLYDRVEEAKKYIKEHKLWGKKKNIYLQEVGLLGVWDKMSTNYKLQNFWQKTKAAGQSVWSSFKKVNSALFNSQNAKKAFSITRLMATPITKPLGWAWKLGTFPFRLTGRAIKKVSSVPGTLLRSMSDSALIRYLKYKKLETEEKLKQIEGKITKLRAKEMAAPYKWDKKRINRKITKLELEAQFIATAFSKIMESANKRKLGLANTTLKPAEAKK